MLTDTDLIIPVTDAIGALQEAKRLRKLGVTHNSKFWTKECAEELFWTLDCLDIDHKVFINHYIEMTNET